MARTASRPWSLTCHRWGRSATPSHAILQRRAADRRPHRQRRRDDAHPNHEPRWSRDDVRDDGRRAVRPGRRAAADPPRDAGVAGHRRDIRWPIRPGPRPRRSAVDGHAVRRDPCLCAGQASAGLPRAGVDATPPSWGGHVRRDAPRLGGHAGHLEASLPDFRRRIRPLLRTPREGADTTVWLAAASTPAIRAGRLYLDRRPRSFDRVPWTRVSAADRRRLWDMVVDLAAIVDPLPAAGRSAA